MSNTRAESRLCAPGATRQLARGVAGAVDEALQLVGLAGGDELVERRPAPAGTGRSARASSSRLAISTSRHICGSLAAMRLKSRKPGPASDRNSVALRLAGDAVHQREGDQVRQVADGGEGRVVRLGRHAQHLAAQGLPQRGGLVKLGGCGCARWVSG
jgi:hypothetical protein